MRKEVTVIINTINENYLVLKRAVNSYRGQCSQIILSTIEGDSCIGKFEGVEYAIIKKKDHVGKSPKGAYQQINNALKLFKGDFLCYASGNDYAEPNKIQTELDCLLSTNKDICYSSFYSVTKDVKTPVLFFDYDYQKHLNNNFVSDCSLISKRIVDKYLPYNLELNNMAHYDSWLRIFNGEGNVFHYNPIPTWNYIQNENDMSKLRMKDKSKIQQNFEDRQRMLNKFL